MNDVPLPVPRPKNTNGGLQAGKHLETDHPNGSTPSSSIEKPPSGNPLRPTPDTSGGGLGSALLPKGQARALTGGEISMLQKYFKNSLSYSAVKIHFDKFTFIQPEGTAMTPRGEAYFPGYIYKDDYSQLRAEARSLFVHEMTHVWQFQNNVVGNIQRLGIRNMINYQREGPITHNAGQYMYDYSYHPREEGILDLLNFGFEQQAAIIQDYYRIVNYAGCTNCSNILALEDYDDPSYGLLRNFLQNPSYAKGHGSDSGVQK